MNFLGLDLSSQRCGWCAGDEFATPVADAIILPQVGSDLGLMGDILWEGLASINRRLGPFDHVLIEDVLLLPRDKKLTLRKLYGVDVIAKTFFRRAHTPYDSAPCQDLKNELTGKRNAIKADMVYVAEKVGIELPLDLNKGREDAADAFAAWRLDVRLRGDKKASMAWDQRIYGGRGSHLF